MRKAGIFDEKIDTTSETVHKIVSTSRCWRLHFFWLIAMSRLQKSLLIHNINVLLCLLTTLEIGFPLS